VRMIMSFIQQDHIFWISNNLRRFHDLQQLLFVMVFLFQNTNVHELFYAE
jgi:hypothetical protein